jgi:outer membrane protein, heavy metal efflux system
MNPRRAAVVLFLFLTALWLSSCATPQRYRPAPISSVQTASSVESRTLADPGLKLYLEKNLGREFGWPLRSWNLRTLTLAAFYFSPALDSARARMAGAEAAIVTAGARPNPSVGITPGVPSPYLLTLDFAVPIETAGKRGYRIQRARRLSEAARLDLAQTAWTVRSGVRKALLDYFLAVRNLDLLRAEERLRREQVVMLGQRLSVGEIPRPEVDASPIELSKALVTLRAAEGRVLEARAALAAAIGIPPAALDRVELAWPEIDRTPSPESPSVQLMQRQAVLNRLDVRRKLAEYAAAGADLQLEIARQYPDFQLGPGYTFEERNSFFTVGVSVALPILNRNQGPIAEAEARRKEVGASFLATQARVIAESEAALTRYRAALKELVQADESLNRVQVVREQMAQRMVRLGESDRLGLDAVILEGLALASGRLDAFGRAQGALGELEDAVQRPLEPGDRAPLTPDSSVLREPRKESHQ